MSTGDRKVNIYLKKFLPQQQMVDNFQDLVQKFTEDLYSRIFPESGVFRGGLFSSTAPDTFDISTPLEGSNSEGVDIVFDPSLGTQVPFENELGIDYYVGLQFTYVPSEVETNVRTGKLKYVFAEEAIGERADPDLVVDDGDGTMTIRVNSVTEAGVDNSGRTVRVFLKSTEDGGGVGPQTLITPFEDLTVQYNGTHNYIETTTGLGQSSTLISTSANDYEVVLIGPSVKRNTDLRLIDEVIFLGIIEGAGAGNSPTTFDQADRRVLGGGGVGGGGLTPQIFAVFETDGTVKHDETIPGKITWSNNLYYRPFGSSDEIEVAASNITLADDEVAFLQIPDPFIGGVDVIQKSPRSSVGLQSPDRYWLFHRDGNLIKVRGGLQLEQGEERQLDDIVIGNFIYLSADDKLRFTDADNVFHFDADGLDDGGEIAVASTVNFGDPAFLNKIQYSAGLLSVLLANSVTGSAVSAGRFASQRANATDTAFEALVTADVVSRFLVQSDGQIEWSDGGLAADTDLFREAAGILATTNIIKSLLGTIRLNDIDITRESASLIGILSELRVNDAVLRMGAEVNNDFLKFVEGGTPYWELKTNNIQRWRVDENGDAVAARDQQTESSTGYTKPSDATVITGVNASLNEVSDRLKSRELLKITANNVADKAINIAAGRLTLASTEEVGLVDSDSLVVNFAGSTVNFGTGVVSVGDNFTPYTPTGAARFFKYGLFLNLDNEIVVIVPESDDAVREDAEEPQLEGGIPIGVITCESISATPGDIQVIVEEDILFFGSAGSGGGGGGDLSFTIRKIAGSTATIGKGSLEISDGRVYVTGSGTDSETVEVEFDVDLTSLIASPADDTTYYLYLDFVAAPAAIYLTDNGRKVIRIYDPTHFLLSTTTPDEIDRFRFKPVGFVHTADSGNSYTGTGSFFGSSPRRSHDLFLDFVSVPQRKQFVATTATTQLFTHGFNGIPQVVELYYKNSAGKIKGENANRCTDKTTTQVEISSLGLTFGSGQELIAEVIYFPEIQNQVVTGSKPYESAWYQAVGPASLALPAGYDREDIKGYVTQEWDVITDRVRNLDYMSGIVTEFDDTNIYLNWSGVTPSANLRYRIVASGTPTAHSFPTFIGGFNKFIGFGPNSFPTLAAWLADPNTGPGDAVLITKDYTITSGEDVNINDVKIMFMPGVKITVEGGSKGLILSGNNIHVYNPRYLVDFAGTLAAALELTGDDCAVSEAFVEADDAGLTLTDPVKIDAGANRCFTRAMFKDTSSAAVTNPNGTDASSNSELIVLA
jgi:hypothetical protein